ncbi:unnamed protein product, partial [Mycena citricolor]
WCRCRHQGDVRRGDCQFCYSRLDPPTARAQLNWMGTCGGRKEPEAAEMIRRVQTWAKILRDLRSHAQGTGEP